MTEKNIQDLVADMANFERRINKRLSEGDARMSRMEGTLQSTLGSMREDMSSMKEMLEAWQATRFVGRAAMWLVSIAGSVALLVQAVRGKLF